MQHEYVLVDVFSDQQFGGNQLAVLPDARGLTSEVMQAVAREFNLAETVFVLPTARADATHRLRIFTPAAEMPFAGHPTVGAAAVLAPRAPRGDGAVRLILEEDIGLVRATVRTDGDSLFSELELDAELETSPAPAPRLLAELLGIPAAAVRQTWFAGVGVRFCFCQLRSAEEVDAARLDHHAWSAALARAWAPQVFVFAGDLTDRSTLHARMFAPALGIQEDAATGSAAAALVLLAAVETDVRACRITIRQGVAMGRPSTLTATATRSAEPTAGRSAGRVAVGGHVTPFATGTLRAPHPTP